MTRTLLSICFCLFLGCGFMASKSDQDACQTFAGQKNSKGLKSTIAPENAPLLGDLSQRYTVQMEADKTYLRWQTKEFKGYGLYVDEEVKISIKDDKAATVAMTIEEAGKSSWACSNIKGRFYVELEPGKYTLELEKMPKFREASKVSFDLAIQVEPREF